jgi:hypothetical protein
MASSKQPPAGWPLPRDNGAIKSGAAPPEPSPGAFSLDPSDSLSRWNRGAWILRDDTLQKVEFILDEAFCIPGTAFRFGLDGIIGVVPAVGDIAAGLLSLLIPLAAWVRGVPYVTLLRMAANLGIGVLVGSIPLFGDIFDIVWKANRRNYRLLKIHVREPLRHTRKDWTFLLALVAIIGMIFAIPVLLVIWFLAWLLHH